MDSVTRARSPLFLLLFLPPVSPLVVLSFGTFSRFLPGIQRASIHLALLRFRFCTLKSSKVMIDEALSPLLSFSSFDYLKFAIPVLILYVTPIVETTAKPPRYRLKLSRNCSLRVRVKHSVTSAVSNKTVYPGCFERQDDKRMNETTAHSRPKRALANTLLLLPISAFFNLSIIQAACSRKLSETFVSGNKSQIR